MSLSQIDFARLYRERMRWKKRRERTPEYWDARAPAMSKRLRHYFDTHRDRMAREPTWWAMFSWEARARAGRR